MAQNRRKFIHWLFILIIAALAISHSTTAWADTRYVSDQLVVSMREGSSPGSPAVAFLVAGTPVEVIEETEEHLLVRIANGQQGWVRSKFILAKRPKSMIIEELKAKIEELESEIQAVGTQTGATPEESSDNQEIYELKINNLETVLEKEKQSSAALQTELKEMKTRNKTLQADANRLSKQNKSLAKQGDGSDTLKNEIKRLQQANQALNQEIDQLKTAEAPYTLSGGIKWFLTGGGVLLLGILLGRSVRKKNPYGY